MSELSIAESSAIESPVAEPLKAERVIVELPDDTVSAATLSAPKHGGDIRTASRRYGIAMEHWLDLSTGINPDAYPIATIPVSCFQRLPGQYDDRLIKAAGQYYGSDSVLPAAGSQRLIELLPTLRHHCRVAVPDIGYQEHGYQWQRNGHSVVQYNGWRPQRLTQLIAAEEVDVVVLINPCNPTATQVDVEQIEHWRELLAERGGWLIVDEAFADAQPQHSAAAYSHLPALIVLRSLGKFFGLAGIRVGFALAAQPLMDRMITNLGPWSISGPSQYIAINALTDSEWQHRTRQRLAANSRWMREMLQNELRDMAIHIVSTAFFISVLTDREIAQMLHTELAKRGILVRLWLHPRNDNSTALLRFGLISEQNQTARQRFYTAVKQIVSVLATA